MINNVVSVTRVPRRNTLNRIIANMATNVGAFPVSDSLMGFLLLYSCCWNKFKLVDYDWSFGLYLNEIVTWSMLFGLFRVIGVGAARAVS
jgi:hypothetical protein